MINGNNVQTGTLDFPGGPGPGATYAAPNGLTYTYDGTKGVWTCPAGAQLGLGLALNGGFIKLSMPVAVTPPATGTAQAQATDGSMYWDSNLGQLFVRYNDGTTTQWVAAAPPGGTAPPPFPPGTVMLFAQATAPTGWTQLTGAAYNNSSIRLVTGAGGGNGGTIPFNTLFSPVSTYTGAVNITSGQVGDTTLSIAQLASHDHPYDYPQNGALTGKPDGTNGFDTGRTTGATGGNAVHSHTLVGATANGNFTSNFDVQYVDVIAASKN
jgi:hypothetical protein